MAKDYSINEAAQAVEMGDLLTNTISAVVQAQERLDAYSLQRKEEFDNAPEGSLALPPLWYTFNSVAVELELSVTVGTVEATSTPSAGGSPPSPQPQLLCRTLNPTMVGLYGYQASAGIKMRVLIGPQGFMPIKKSDTNDS